MIRVRLETHEGAQVVYGEIPPFKDLPDVLLWGLRMFKNTSHTESDATPIYRECFAVAVVRTDLYGAMGQEAPAEKPRQVKQDADAVPAPVREGLTTDRSTPCLHEIQPNGQQACYLVLSEEERAKGYVRPVRQTYRHITCGVQTSMSLAIAQTYARDPKYYGATFCCGCGTHPDLLIDGVRQFEWIVDGKWDGSFVGE